MTFTLPSFLPTPGALEGSRNVAVTQDGDNRAILTWEGEYNYPQHLYYALLGGDGSVLTPATIFRSDNPNTPYLMSGDTGYGNTSYSWTPPAGVDVSLDAADLAPGRPDGGARLDLSFMNQGAEAATGVAVTLNLSPTVRAANMATGALTYLSDTSGIVPAVTADGK